MSAAPRLMRCRRLAAGIAASIGLAAGIPACVAQPSTAQVTMLVPWSGSQLAIFEKAVLGPFEAMYKNISVNVESTRALIQEIDAGLQQGDPPTLADVSSIGAIDQYATGQYPGGKTDVSALAPLDNVAHASEYPAPWSSLMRPVRDGHVYAVPVKIDVKSLIWYAPPSSPPSCTSTGARRPAGRVLSVPRTPSNIRTSRRGACRSRRPRRQAGPAPTGSPTSCLANTRRRTSNGPPAKGRGHPVQFPQAWELWGKLIGTGNAVYRGDSGALTQGIGTISPVDSSSGCYLGHGALIDQSFPGSPEYSGDYAHFAFPSSTGSGPVQVSGDFVVMFNNKNQNAATTNAAPTVCGTPAL